MDSLEHSSLVIAAAALITDARAIAAGWSDSEQADRVRKLELGLARRKVELYERMLAERFADISHATDPDTMRDLLAGARARLAELEEAEAVRRCNACPAPATCGEFGRCTLKQTTTPERN